MAKCEKCGEEYPEGTEHVCSSQTEKQEEQQKNAGEEATKESP